MWGENVKHTVIHTIRQTIYLNSVVYSSVDCSVLYSRDDFIWCQIYFVSIGLHDGNEENEEIPEAHREPDTDAQATMC